MVLSIETEPVTAGEVASHESAEIVAMASVRTMTMSWGGGCLEDILQLVIKCVF